MPHHTQRDTHSHTPCPTIQLHTLALHTKVGQIETERQLLDIYVETEEITRAEFDRKMAVLAELERFVDANAAALAAELEAQRQAEQATAGSRPSSGRP